MSYSISSTNSRVPANVDTVLVTLDSNPGIVTAVMTKGGFVQLFWIRSGSLQDQAVIPTSGNNNVQWGSRLSGDELHAFAPEAVDVSVIELS